MYTWIPVLVGIIVLLVSILCGGDNSTNTTTSPSKTDITDQTQIQKADPKIYELSHRYGNEKFEGTVLPWEMDQSASLSRMDISRITLNGGAVTPWITEWEKLETESPSITSTTNPRAVVCLISDQFDRVQETLKMIRDPEKGQWTGDILLITTKTSAYKDYDLSDVNHIFLLDILSPDQTTPSRSQRASFQQFKIYMFHPRIREMWDVLMYIDAGMHVRQPVSPIFEQELWPRRFVAHSDSYNKYVWDLNTQFEHLLGDPDIPDGHLDYFQTTFALFDTQKLCHQMVLDELLKLFRAYPNHYNNEQSIMNLLLRNVWQPLSTDRNLLDNQGLIPYNFCQNDYSIARMYKKSCQEPNRFARFYVLNGVDPLRRPRLETEFASSQVPSTMIEWITWPNKSDLTESLRQQITENEELKLGAVCCVYKHYLCLKDIVEKNLEYAVIMEDNVTFFDPNVRILPRIERYIGELNQFYPDWDILFDSSYLPVTEHIVESQRFVYPKSLVARPGCGGGSRVAQFYLIRNKAAKRLLEMYLPADSTPDHWMNNLFRKLDMQVYWSQPPMVATEKNHVSTQ